MKKLDRSAMNFEKFKKTLVRPVGSIKKAPFLMNLNWAQ